MYVRLAFAVAAHLEPEILVVDEVLAVGDAEFQKKCLGKMGEVAGHGRTVLFVSHNMGAIGKLCSRGLLLEHGKLGLVGSARSVVDGYIAVASSNNGNFKRQPNAFAPHVKTVEFLDPATKEPRCPTTGTPLTLRIHFYVPDPIREASVVVQISSAASGELLFFTSSRPDCNVPMRFRGGDEYADLCFDPLLLAAGRYVLGAGLAIPDKEWLYWEPHGPLFDVSPFDVFSSGLPPTLQRNGIPIPHCWSSPELLNRPHA